MSSTAKGGYMYHVMTVRAESPHDMKACRDSFTYLLSGTYRPCKIDLYSSPEYTLVQESRPRTTDMQGSVSSMQITGGALPTIHADGVCRSSEDYVHCT